jgi:hypothetical protein
MAIIHSKNYPNLAIVHGSMFSKENLSISIKHIVGIVANSILDLIGTNKCPNC